MVTTGYDGDSPVGELVCRYRAEAGLTQEELALRSGLGVRTISDIERGRTAAPRRSSLALLWRALGVSEFAAGSRVPAAPVASPAGPASRRAAVPRQLPPGIRHLSGRRRELAALDRLLGHNDPRLDSAAICVISGTAGVGKTALAVQWAHRAAERFPDGQLYADLQGFGPAGDAASPAAVLTDFIGALSGRADRMPARPDGLTSRYRSMLAGKRVLIVLDNARDAGQIRPLLPGTPGCAVIVTCRCQLPGFVATHDAYSLTLDLLGPAEASEMLASRLGPERAAGQSAIMDEVAGLCGRLPAALAIVAARAALGPSHMLSGLAAELRDPASRLDVLDAGEMSIRAMFSWSYQALSDPAAAMFRLFGRNPAAQISTAGAASMAALPVAGTRAILAELITANLLAEPAPGRYTCHSLLRDYAAGLAERTRSETDRPAGVLTAVR